MSRGAKRALVLSAHPDDETICAGGTMALLARSGVAVTICCSTRGEGGVVGSPPVCRPQDLGACRTRELRRAGRVLGAAAVTFLGYVDPPVAAGHVLQAATGDVGEYAGRILRVLRRRRPLVVITHGSNGEYGHPQHVVTHRAMLAAWREWDNDSAALYTFAAAASPGQYFSAFRNAEDVPTLVVDIRSVLDLKHRAFACHASQIAVTLRDAGLSDMAGMFPAWEALRRWAGPPLLEEWLDGVAIAVAAEEARSAVEA